MANKNEKSLIIIPTYNERENIANIFEALLALRINDLNILIVDDNSPDGTAEVVEQYIKRNYPVSIIKRSSKMGLGTAYIKGFKYALEKDYDYIFEMDADLSHDPKEIPNFLKAIKNADLVIGSRYLTGVNVINWPLLRLFISVMANKYSRIISGLPIHDCTSGFKCFRRSVLGSIPLDEISSSGYAFQIEMNYKTWKRGFKISEIPIVFYDRTVGSSKMSKKIIIEAIFIVWKLKILSIFDRY
jgi:dolichol-phosphate mannosyltransferase